MAAGREVRGDRDGHGQDGEGGDDFLGSYTVVETLEFANADSRRREPWPSTSRACMYGSRVTTRVLIYWQPSVPEKYSDLSQYRRLDRFSGAKGLLVIYGSGHLGWLRQDIANDATVKLQTLADFSTGRHVRRSSVCEGRGAKTGILDLEQERSALWPNSP